MAGIQGMQVRLVLLVSIVNLVVTVSEPQQVQVCNTECITRVAIAGNDTYQYISPLSN